MISIKGVRKRRGFGVNPPLSLIFYKNFIACVKEINCFLIGFGGNLYYRLHPETISPLFADLSPTTHV